MSGWAVDGDLIRCGGEGAEDDASRLSPRAARGGDAGRAMRQVEMEQDALDGATVWDG